MITNGRLDGVRHVPAADMGGHLALPRWLLIHYTGGSGAVGAIGQLTTRDDTYVSAHLLLAPDGEVTQMVPFGRQAYHAGQSKWMGVSRLNAYTIGLELVNPGYMRPGSPRSWPTIRAAHQLVGGPMREWYVYPEEQLASAAAVCAKLLNHYTSLEGILGHDDVAHPRGRKLDPGPAFPMVAFRERVKALGVVG